MIGPTSPAACPPARGRTTPAPRATTALLAALVLGILATLAGPPPPAGAQEPPRPIRVDLTSFEPAVPSRDGELTIKGTLTNTSDDPIANVRAYLWRNQAPLTNRTSLDEVLAGEATPTGDRVPIDGAFQNVTLDRGPMQPGEKLAFTVTAKIADLDFPRRGGVYLTGVDVLGQVDNGPTSVPGRTRLFLPLPAASDAPPTRTKITSIVALTSQPSMLTPGVFADDHLATELARGGRLTALLAAAGRPGMSWAIDPSLHEELSAMAAGYRVREADGTLTDGGGAELARRWLTQFERLDRSAGFRLPYATLDLRAATRTDDPWLIDQSARLGEASELGDLPLLAWGGDGELDQRTLEAVRPFGPTAVLTSNADSAHRLLAAQPASPAPLVRYDPLAYTGGPLPADGVRPLHQRQRLLGESLVDAISQVGGGGTVRLITQPDEAAADAASDAPWVERLTLTGLLDSDPQEWNGTFREPDAPTLSDEQLGALAELRGDVGSYLGAWLDPDRARPQFDAVLVRGASATWRGAAEARDGYLDPIRRELADFFAGRSLSLRAQSRVTMSNQQGQFPVTIANALPESLRVSVVFDSENAARLKVPPVRDVVVGGGESTTVTLSPEAAGNGTVGVTGHLVTPDGRRIGNGVKIDVEATQLGAVGWVIVAISGVVLAVSTLLRIRQVRREGRGSRRGDRATGTGRHPADARVGP